MYEWYGKHNIGSEEKSEQLEHLVKSETKQTEVKVAGTKTRKGMQNKVRHRKRFNRTLEYERLEHETRRRLKQSKAVIKVVVVILCKRGKLAKDNENKKNIIKKTLIRLFP